VADRLIEALRSGKLTDVRAAVKANPKAARSPLAIVETGRLAYRAAAELLAAQWSGSQMRAGVDIVRCTV
jgi:hypothetical protein